MTIKERLREIKYIDSRIDSLLRQIDRLRDMATAIDYSRDRVNGGSGRDLSDTIAKIDSYERMINAEIDTLIEKKKSMNALVAQLHEPYKDLIDRYYFEGRTTWEKIAVDLNFSYRQTMRIHGIALKKLEGLEKMAQNVT